MDWARRVTHIYNFSILQVKFSSSSSVYPYYVSDSTATGSKASNTITCVLLIYSNQGISEKPTSALFRTVSLVLSDVMGKKIEHWVDQNTKEEFSILKKYPEIHKPSRKSEDTGTISWDVQGSESKTKHIIENQRPVHGLTWEQRVEGSLDYVWQHYLEHGEWLKPLNTCLLLLPKKMNCRFPQAYASFLFVEILCHYSWST